MCGPFGHCKTSDGDRRIVRLTNGVVVGEEGGRALVKALGSRGANAANVWSGPKKAG